MAVYIRYDFGGGILPLSGKRTDSSGGYRRQSWVARSCEPAATLHRLPITWRPAEPAPVNAMQSMSRVRLFSSERAAPRNSDATGATPTASAAPNSLPGSRLIGRYDSQVAFGQQRVLLVWLRIILPDTSSIALDKLPGIDQAGYAGVEDGVDWHWGRVLAGAALATMLGVSSELAVSDQGSTNGNVVIALRNSAQDTTNQVGQEVTRRNLSVQPTLTVRPGFPMDVMVNKDLVLRPYQPLFFQRGSLQ
jgi:hypothetical protein